MPGGTLAAAALAGLLLAGCGGAAAPPASSAAPAGSSPESALLKVSYATASLTAEAGVYLAIDRGYFKQEGLDLSLEPLSMLSIIPPLSTGQLDLGATTPTPAAFNAMNSGIGLQIIAPQSIIPPSDRDAGLVVRPDLIESGRFKSIKDLKGMTIGMADAQPNATSSVYLDRVLAKAGLTNADVTQVTVRPPDQPAALANKKIDAGWTVEPFITLAQDKGAAKLVITLGDVFPNAPAFFAIVSPVFAKAHPDAVRRFVKAHLRGQRDYYRTIEQGQGDKEAVFQVLAKYTAIKDLSLYARMGLPNVDPNDGIDEKLLDQYQDFYVRAGTQKTKADLSKVINREYVNDALKELGTFPA
jgi:NitT/TauT family transport system substrate-binding protein